MYNFVHIRIKKAFWLWSFVISIFYDYWILLASASEYKYYWYIVGRLAVASRIIHCKPMRSLGLGEVWGSSATVISKNLDLKFFTSCYYQLNTSVIIDIVLIALSNFDFKLTSCSLEQKSNFLP